MNEFYNSNFQQPIKCFIPPFQRFSREQITTTVVEMVHYALVFDVFYIFSWFDDFSICLYSDLLCTVSVVALNYVFSMRCFFCLAKPASFRFCRCFILGFHTSSSGLSVSHQLPNLVH